MAKGVKRAALDVSTTTLVGNDDPGDNVIPLLTGRQEAPDKPEASR